ncbi:hypothetical protein BKA62DRAFT_682307 [Auriculariales sp. MPI-PUGE-AT-0066]|nr:hypothetical protein BKA62DRAFT_682307 [Auriculariales sp. MPI-PUGE-AT-0066]
MHSKTNQHAHAQRSATLLDPCYHLGTKGHSGQTSSCSSTPSRATTWTDETGEHDPDFRPFESIAIPHIHTSAEQMRSPRRRSLELPAKHARNLEPSLHAALRAHERAIAEQKQRDEAKSHRCESRRPSFLGLRPCRSRSSLDRDQHQHEAVVYDDSDDDSSSYAYSPPPLPALTLDHDTEDEEDDESSTKDHKDRDLHHKLAGLHLSVELALFRAKKRFRRRVGLD